MKIKKIILEVLGWYGVVAVIAAYFLVSFLIIKPDGFVYQFLNASGALFLCVVSGSKKAYQPATSNGLWAVIAFVAIIKMFFF